MRKIPQRKRATRSLKPRSNVDPTRVAIAALDRIKTMLVKSGYEDRLGPPLGMTELAEQAQELGTELPPSYVATMRIASRIGEPEMFLSSRDMAIEAEDIVSNGGEEAKRYAPFCRAHDKVVCFDKGVGRRPPPNLQHPGELPVVEWENGNVAPLAAHFGEWLDTVADAREESMESAAKMPARLKRLLYELGFRFEYPVVGRLETSDIAAVEELLGRELVRAVRGDVDRLFDSSGRASMTLNVDEFTVAVSLRTGIYVFEAEDVFRWLRHFRDENFFGDVTGEPSHADNVRDLRRAPREPPAVLRGVLPIAALPATRHVFRAATGTSGSDFYVLGRTASTSDRANSLVLRVIDGEVTTAQRVDEPLNDLYLAPDGAMWGLTPSHAVRFVDGEADAFPLERPTRGRAWWYGIGGGGGRVVVWGSGALLEFDGERFVAFEPDANLDESESVVALSASGLRLSMLVCGDRMGAVARFDSVHWMPIREYQVIEGSLADLDVWRGTAYVLDRNGGVWKVDKGAPRALALPLRHQAFLTEAGTRRPLHAVRATDGVLLLASQGGVIALGSGEPLFHAAPDEPGSRDPVRLQRVGELRASASDPHGGSSDDTAVVALAGANVWLWDGKTFLAVDVRDF